VEQFTAAPATRHELCAFQASTENISILELFLCLRNTLTYLLKLCGSRMQPVIAYILSQFLLRPILLFVSVIYIHIRIKLHLNSTMQR